jgi:hypothetical protein
MMYGIILRANDGSGEWFYDSILSGLIPDHVFDLMVDSVVDKDLGLCRLCDVHGARCHVIDFSKGGRKLCPVLFVDAVHPPWTVAQVEGSNSAVQ